jgi:hypothetical protein
MLYYRNTDNFLFKAALEIIRLFWIIVPSSQSSLSKLYAIHMTKIPVSYRDFRHMYFVQFGQGRLTGRDNELLQRDSNIKIFFSLTKAD